LIDTHRAREEFGARLRRLRQDAGLNGKQLAAALSWPHSKVSKIELGRQRPTADEVTAWAQATGATADIDALLADLRSLRVESASWRRQLRGGTAPGSGPASPWSGRPPPSGRSSRA